MGRLQNKGAWRMAHPQSLDVIQGSSSGQIQPCSNQQPAYAAPPAIQAGRQPGWQAAGSTLTLHDGVAGGLAGYEEELEAVATRLCLHLQRGPERRTAR